MASWVLGIRIVRRLLVVCDAPLHMPELLFVPLGELVVVLSLDRQMLYVILLAKLEPRTVPGLVQQGQLQWVPLLCVDLLQISLAHRIRVEMNGRAGLADEDAEVALEVARLVPEAVYAVGVVGILSNHRFEHVSKLLSAVLRGELRYGLGLRCFGLGS